MLELVASCAKDLPTEIGGVPLRNEPAVTRTTLDAGYVPAHRETGTSNARVERIRGASPVGASAFAGTGGTRRYKVDLSRALINRSSAYYLARDLVRHLPDHFAAARYWRIVSPREPRGALRWLLGAAMLRAFDYHANIDTPRRVQHACSARPTLFLDPLHVLRTGVTCDDIVLCHHVGPVTHPSLFQASTVDSYKVSYDTIARARPGMVFVSEASRHAFVERYGDEFRFLRTIPLYVRRGSELGDDSPPPGIREPFLLTVGALEVRKNYLRIIEAFSRSGLAKRGYTHVICGPRGNSAALVQQMAEETPGVHAIGYQTDAELRWLYRNASGFVLPSLLEGFGLTALEAAKHGLLSLVSADSAQAEAVGGGAVLVNPLSIGSIAAGIQQLVDMTDVERQARIETALRRTHELSLDLFLQRWSALLRTT